ncbi:TetR/AcrR family transcriptional regulator [Amycolatopsis sp. NPDC004368]
MSDLSRSEELPAPEPSRPGRRADATRNHRKVLVAAHEVFAELGLRASVTRVAERAGVTKATIYRNYPTKDALVDAVVEDRFRLLEDRTRAALSEPDAPAAFRVYLVDLFEQMAGDRLLADALADATTVRAGPVLELIGRLIDAAKPSGEVRGDLSILDLRVVVCGVVLQLNRLDDRDPAVWRRYGELALAAFRS